MPGGFINYANWTFGYAIYGVQGPLRISHAHFRGRSVLYRGEAPFVLTSQEGGRSFKSGLGPAGGGLPFTPLLPSAPNGRETDIPASSVARNDSQYDLIANPGGAAMVERFPSTSTEPAKVAVWAKLQSGDYQYIHRWEFHEDGTIVAQISLGGKHPANTAGRRVTHEFYYRLDLDIDNATGLENAVQRSSPDDPTGWRDVAREETQRIDPRGSTTWRVLHKSPSPDGRFRSYELFPNSDRSSEATSQSGDVWVVRYRPEEDGTDVGTDAQVLTTRYVSGERIDGQDPILWYCLRLDHWPRNRGEEHGALLYRHAAVRLVPRDFLDETPTNLYATSPASP